MTSRVCADLPGMARLLLLNEQIAILGQGGITRYRTTHSNTEGRSQRFAPTRNVSRVFRSGFCVNADL
jgi:hypothetical protein